MSLTPAARQRHILELLDARRSLTIQELAAEFGVSAMTVHRDLNRLADAGQLLKTRGGAALPSRANNHSGVPAPCAMCNRLVPERSAVIMQSQQRGRLTACCPHCGLALVDRDSSTDLMLVTDFLYCRMISASEATYLVGSEVSLCCGPGILAFAGVQDAIRFQRGFGGEVMDFMQAQKHLRHKMSVSA
jgi:DeoR family transcriptional regulator, copper-sensing transcriptional repressor